MVYIATLFIGALLQAAPVIQNQPVSQTVNEQDPVTISVTATGTGTLSYQWQKDGVDIPGATSSSFSLASARRWHIGDYTVKVTDTAGSTSSNAASVNLTGISSGIWKGLLSYYRLNGTTVDQGIYENHFVNTNAAPAVDRKGNSASAYSFNGTTAWMVSEKNLPITGASPRTFSFWMKREDRGTLGGNPTIIGHGLKSGTGNFFNLTLEGGSGKNLFIHGSWISTYTNLASPTPIEEWIHVAVCSDGTALGTYFYINGVPTPRTSDSGNYNTISSKLRISTSSDSGGISNENTFWWNAGFKGAMDEVRVYNRSLSQQEVAALYAFESQSSTQIFTQPQSASVQQGNAVSLNVDATGSGELSYQWQKDGVDLPGATSATLTISSFKPWHVGSYRVRVSDSVDSVWSNPAQLSLDTTQPASLWQDLLLFLPFAGSNTDLSASARAITQSNVGFGESPAGTPAGSAAFNGTSSRMDFAPNLPNLAEMTFSAWIRPSRVNTYQAIFVDWDDAAGNDVGIVLNNNKFNIVSSKNGSSLNWTSAFNVEQDKWIHLTCSMASGKTIILIDGILVADINQTSSNSGYKLRSNIGYFKYYGGKDYFSGNLAALRIYGRALTLQEAQAVYTADAPPGSKTPTSIQWANLLQIDDGASRLVAFTSTPPSLPFALLYAGEAAAPSQPGRYAVTATLDHPIYSGSGSATLTILGLSGRDQRLTSGSSQPQEANGTDFGRVILGRVATQTFTITNPGTAPVALTGSPLVEILGDHPGDFQVSVAPLAEIPAGGSVSFEVRFAPTQPDARQAVVSVACDALANGPITFAVGGLGAFPTMLAQTITFNLPASFYLSQGPVPLIATASSGLPVTLTVLSGPATLEDGLLILTEPGTVKVQASQEGGGNFAPAKPVVRTLTVKADPTGLTLADLTQTYNGTPRPVTVLGTEEEVTVTYFINKLPSDSPPTDAGSYPVTAVAGPVTKKATLVITKTPLIVQVADLRKMVGEANPSLTAEVTGFIGEDTENTVMFRPISLSTKAKDNSPPGLYPITSSGGAAVNYTFIHRPGTLVVEGYVGNFEALLRDPDTDLPVGLLKLTVPTTSRSLTASLALADQAKPLALAGPLELDPETRVASAQLSRIVNKTDTYQLDLTLSLFGELAVVVRRNDTLLAQAEDGARLRDAVKGETVPPAGAYTMVLEPAADDAAPSAPGWATVKVDAAGMLALAGRLGDGTSFTASLPEDVSDDYRLFLQPYKRAAAYMGGAWHWSEHPEVAGAWQVRGAELTWEKGAGDKDPGYRAGFGPLAVALEMDAWQPASKTLTLAQLLGTTELSVSHDSTGSDSEVLLANRVAVDPAGVLRVLTPVTNPPNLRKWTAKVNPATGAYTGSFELFDLTQKRKVSFSGVLRQAADAEAAGLQGRGHYLLPPLKGAPSTETTTGRMEFRRVVE
jgi:hypothetical protein